MSVRSSHLPLSLGLVLGGLCLAALTLQLLSGTPLWSEAGPLSFAQALLIGLLSLPCAAVALRVEEDARAQVVWGITSAALLAVSLAQLGTLIFEALPESRSFDVSAAAAWGAAAVALLLMQQRGRTFRRGRTFALAGFYLQSFAFLADSTDGGGFGLSVDSLRLLGAADELFEMLVLAVYLTGLTVLATEGRADRSAGARSWAIPHALPAPFGPSARGRRMRPTIPGRDGQLAQFETWPAWLFYAPIAGYVVWRGLASGGIALPSSANPVMGGDGILNVSKSRIFKAMGPAGRRSLPQYLVVERAPGVGADRAVAIIVARMARAGLAFPVVAKPDRGGRGAGVSLVRSEEELRAFVAGFPPSCSFLLQQFVALEHEAGVMYVRPPGEPEGRVVSLALKEAPAVVGDGRRTLRELIEGHPRARHHRSTALREHRAALDRVPRRGERVELIFARNHCRGAIFRDGTQFVTPALERRIDEIARSIPGFHIGRFDIRFSSLARLQEGSDLFVIEVNGAVSEPIHAWDPGNTIGQAWRIYMDQIDRLYAVGAASRALGHRGEGLPALIAGWWRQRRVSRAYPGGG